MFPFLDKLLQMREGIIKGVQKERERRSEGGESGRILLANVQSDLINAHSQLRIRILPICGTLWGLSHSTSNLKLSLNLDA